MQNPPCAQKNFSIPKFLLFNIADQASTMDLKNEEQVRALIQSVGAMVGRKVDKSVEDQLTKMIINGEVPTDMNELLKMMM